MDHKTQNNVVNAIVAVRKAKAKTQEEIRKAVALAASQFEEETGLSITAVDIRINEYHAHGYKPQFTVAECHINTTFEHY